MTCSNCGRVNDADAEFCENCGLALPRVCAQCGSPLKPSAQFCKKCGTPVATPALVSSSPARTADRLADLRRSAPIALQEKFHAVSAQATGERKPVTILFTDIVGSTSLAEKLDPEEWREIVSGAHQRVSEAVYRYEGTIAQLLGDGVLAFFGAPITHEDDPVRAVRAGLDIQHSIEEYNQQLKGYIGNFQLRVGINTGMVVVGNVGSDLHMEYLAIGDAVNLAARLQSAAQPGRVLISEATEKLVKGIFELNALGEISLKGKAQAVAVYEVIERKAFPASGRGIQGLPSPFVGRQPELAILREALAEVSNGRSQIVCVLGEAGLGKSRLVEEARAELVNQDIKRHWLEGRALSYGQTLSFWAITQLIKNDLHLSDAAPESKIKVALRRRGLALFGERAGDVLPYLAQLLNVKLEDESAQRVHQLDGETLKRQMLWAIVEYFQRVAQEQPTVLVFEDLQWADPSTLEALEKLLVLTDRAPLLLLLLARIEREHGSWQIKVNAETNYAHRYTEINLKPLSAEDSDDLVNRLLAVAKLPGDIRRLIFERSEGNPFYLEEIIRSLIEQGALVQEDHTWRATPEMAYVEIPETLQSLLLARIDRLQEDVRRTLQLASVIGKSFLYRLLEAIAGAERELDEHLSQLQRVDLVREKTRRPELEYIFKHSLTQQAAYNSLLVERRKEFHHKVGIALEQLFPDRRDEFLGLLAHHFDAAGDNAKAIEYLIQAGDKGRLADAHPEAIQFYRRAIEVLTEMGDLDRASKTWLKLGLIYQMNFEFEHAHQANETAFELQRQIRTREKRLPIQGAYVDRSQVFRVSGWGWHYHTLDPTKQFAISGGWVASQLFVGLAEFDADTNVVPHAARSWEVLDGGRRYVFHMRDNMRWTDGTPVTALDFEWAWKHNLEPRVEAYYCSLLDDIVGARDYREGRNPDPDSVGVRALDPFTLEVKLVTPVAYFIYLVTQPLTYALPRAIVESYNQDWWRPEHIISNGPFRLSEFDAIHLRLDRNPDYFGEFFGNVDQYVLNIRNSATAALHDYQYGRVDALLSGAIRPDLPDSEHVQGWALFTAGLTLIPTQTPLDDVRVRQAIAHAIDREKLLEVVYGKHSRWKGGGIVPPCMAGHSPEIGLEYNLDKARKLIAEAGYPDGLNLPILNCYYFQAAMPQSFRDELKQQLFDHLGIQIEMPATPSDELWWTANDAHLLEGVWIADYPDPDNFLRLSGYYKELCDRGWHHPRFEQLLETAARTPDRSRRLAMYREADRILVDEEVLAVPLSYARYTSADFVKPWVKGMKYNALGSYSLKNVVIEPH